MSDKDYDFTAGRFPSEQVPNSVKNSEKYGLFYAKAIYNSSCSGATSYYQLRNAEFASNREISSGKTSFDTTLKTMSIDGQNAYVNLSYNPRGIALKFKEVVIGKMMERNERVKATSLSIEVQNRKDRKKSDAQARMSEKEFLEEFQGGTGVQLEDPDAFVPKSAEELDIWAELSDSEREEILMQEAISFVFKNNDYDPVQKRALLSDIWDCGLAVSRDYLDTKGRIIIEVIRPEDFISSPVKNTDFKGAKYMGHFGTALVADLREQFKKVGKTEGLEQKLYDLSYNNRSQYGNTGDLPGTFLNEWNDSYQRPYDDYTVRVFYFTVKLPKQIIYSTGKDKYGKSTFDIKQEVGKKENKNKETFVDSRLTIYSGAWVIGSELMLEWQEASNLIVDTDKETIEHPYCARFVDNSDGKMMPRSMASLMKAPILAMDLDITKMQQIIAGIRRSGHFIDIDAQDGLNLGKGKESVSVLELKEIADQTGDVYYSSLKMSGDQANRRPIEQNIFQLGNTLEQIIGHYNFEANNLRQLIGSNDAADGSSLDPRMGKGVVEQQISVSNTATANLYSTFVQIKQQTAKHAGIRLWDEFKFSKNPNRGYIGILGKRNVAFIKDRKLLTESNYDLNIELDMSDQDRIQLEKDIEIGMGSGLLLEDAIYIRGNFTDYKKASKYLAYQRKVREEMARETAEKNSSTQAQIQMQSAQQASEAKQQELQMEAQVKQMEGQMKSQTALTEKEMDIVRSAMEKLMDNPELQLPQFVQMLIAKYETLEAQRIQAEQEAEMAAQEQAMMEQEQQQVA